jgi:tetratricopeptide (TPR) repeat protein
MVGRLTAIVNERFGRRYWIWAALLAGLAVVLDFVPLFDVLGYDFAFAVGLATALASVDVGQGVVARWRARNVGNALDAAALAKLVGTAVAGVLALLAPPLLLSLANGVRVRDCNLPAGLAFFFLLPVGTAIYAAPAGVLAGAAAPRRGRGWAWAVPFASVAWTLWRLYEGPAVFAFDPFGGYFPGPIYDEALRPPLRLLYFRLANLAWMSAAVMVALAASGRGFDPRRWCRVLALAAVPLVIGSLALFAGRGSLGFAVGRADLAEVLDRTLRTEHFVVRYASSAGKTTTDLALEAEDYEFRYHQLAGTLAVEPAGPVTVWEFPNADIKKAMVGAGHTLYAKPWTREIFLQGERFPSTRLRHELAHVFAGAFGDPLFGVAFAWRWHGPLPVPTLAMGLVEGLAEAADTSDPDGTSTIHEDAAAMIADGLAPPLADIVGAGFSGQSGARAYTMAGSFCAFLLETRGPERLRALYRSAGNFLDVYRTPLATLEDEWRQFLRRQPVTARDRARASEQFRRPAIFKKVCARELAARLTEARGLERVAPAEAVRLLEGACRDDPHEPTYRLELAQAHAFAGDRRAALEGLGRLGGDADVTDPMHAAGASLAAEIQFHARDYANAIAEEKRVLALSTEDGDRRLATVKLRALETPTGRQTLGRALFGDELGAAGADPVLTFHLMSEYARLHPSDRLGPYLVGRQLLGRAPAQAMPFLRRACDDEAPPRAPDAHPAVDEGALSPSFERECRRMVAEAAYRLGDYERARAALTRLAGEADNDAEQLRALDMRARVAWAASRRQGPVGAQPGDRSGDEAN